jgi:membrane-bound metal-dependent hydrolase YbcI (DUF457 family)
MKNKPATDQARLPSGLLLAAVGASILPDMDALPGILFNDFSRFHNNLTHSFMAGLIVALLAHWSQVKDHQKLSN